MEHWCIKPASMQGDGARLCKCLPARRLSMRRGGESRLIHACHPPATRNVMFCASPSPSIGTDKLHPRPPTHNASRTRPSSAGMVRMAHEALSLAEEVAGRFVAAPNDCSAYPGCTALTPHRLRSPRQHILGVQGPAARPAQPPHRQVQPEDAV
jgi:hypothetical protein